MKQLGLLDGITREPAPEPGVVGSKVREVKIGLSGPEHARKTKVRIQITTDFCSAAKGIVGITGADIAAGVGQFASRDKMVARIIIGTSVGSRCKLNALSEEALGDHPVSVVLFGDPRTAPNKQPVRYLGSVHQLPNSHHMVRAVEGELGAAASSIDRREPIGGVPFIGARNSGCGRGV